MTRNARIRKLLAEAPSTCDEIAACLRITTRSARVGMWVLTHSNHARKTGNTLPGALWRPRNLYELTPQGKAAMRG